MFALRLVLQILSLCPPWQSVSRKRRNKAGSFARLAFVCLANVPDLVRWLSFVKYQLVLPNNAQNRFVFPCWDTVFVKVSILIIVFI